MKYCKIDTEMRNNEKWKINDSPKLCDNVVLINISDGWVKATGYVCYCLTYPPSTTHFLPI